MSGFSFALDWRAATFLPLLALVAFVFWKWSSAFQVPRIYFSRPAALTGGRVTLRAKISGWPVRLMSGALIFLVAAFVDPHFFVPGKMARKELEAWLRQQLPEEGIAIYLVLDQSSSMAQNVSGGIRGRPVTKMKLLKEVTGDFIQGNTERGLKGRPSDLIGLVAFARGAHILSPLTLDHEYLMKKLRDLDYVHENDLDGTAMGYAIFKTVNVIAATRNFALGDEEGKKPAYDIKSSVIILVTDGFQSPSPLDKDKDLRNMGLEEAALFAKKNGVRLYIINVEPRLAVERYSAFRNIMLKAADIAGGKYYAITGSSDLQDIYRDIDLLEKSGLPVAAAIEPEELPHIYRRVSLYPYLIFAGMTLIFIVIFLEGVVIRRVP